MTVLKNGIRYSGVFNQQQLRWKGSKDSIVFDESEIKTQLLNLDQACYIITDGKNIGLSTEGVLLDKEFSDSDCLEIISFVPGLSSDKLGNQYFKQSHKTQYAYYGGSMAHGISSEEMVIALGKKGYHRQLD